MPRCRHHAYAPLVVGYRRVRILIGVLDLMGVGCATARSEHDSLCSGASAPLCVSGEDRCALDRERGCYVCVCEAWPGTSRSSAADKARPEGWNPASEREVKQ